jgi:hypothetical protein
MVEHFGTPLNADRHTQGVNRCRVDGPLGPLDAFNAALSAGLRRVCAMTSFTTAAPSPCLPRRHVVA